MASAATTTAPVCSGAASVGVVSFRAAPSTVPAGQSTTATLTLRNCTDQAQQVSSTWYGRFTGATTGIPAGCAAIDPLLRPISLEPSALGSTSMTYTVPASCTATGLDLTAQFTPPGGTDPIVRTTHLTVGAAISCTTTFDIRSWPGGFTDNIAVTNSGAAPITNWRLSFTFAGDEKVIQAWNASVVQTGATVTATGPSWNATVPAGGTVLFGLFGLFGSVSGSPDTPTNVTLNGSGCVVVRTPAP